MGDLDPRGLRVGLKPEVIFGFGADEEAIKTVRRTVDATEEEEKEAVQVDGKTAPLVQGGADGQPQERMRPIGS